MERDSAQSLPPEESTHNERKLSTMASESSIQALPSHLFPLNHLKPSSLQMVQFLTNITHEHQVPVLSDESVLSVRYNTSSGFLPEKYENTDSNTF